MGAALDTPSLSPWLKSYPSTIAWDAPMPSGPLYQLLDQTAERVPDKVCIHFLGKKYTYAQVHDLSNKIAKGLQALGVSKGERVGLFMPNCPYFIFFYFGILKTGATVVNYNPLYVPCEIASQIEDSGTHLMVTLDLEALYGKLKDLMGLASLKKVIVCSLKDSLPFPKSLLFPLLKRKEIAAITYNQENISFDSLVDNDGQYATPILNPQEDIALFQYTGGTTGLPKAAMLTHNNVLANAHQAFLWLKPPADQENKVLAALPLFHVFAMTAVMNLSIKIGAEIIMMFPRFQVKEAIDLMEKHQVNFFPAVPTIYTLINNYPHIEKRNLKALRVCLSGGAPLPLEVKKRFESFTGCSLIEAYGLSETSPAATSNPIEGLHKEGSIGIPFPRTQIKIMSLSNPDEEVALGEKGEICISGPQVMKGYWNRSEENARVLREGLFHTGDVGYMDEDGYTFLVDRIKDLIISNGYNIYPRHVEEVIYQYADVEEVIVIGIPDEQRGEVPKAFIKARNGKKICPQDLFNFLSDKLSPLQMPKQIEMRDQLPKTMIGKLSKKELIQEHKNNINER